MDTSIWYDGNGETDFHGFTMLLLVMAVYATGVDQVFPLGSKYTLAQPEKRQENFMINQLSLLPGEDLSRVAGMREFGLACPFLDQLWTCPKITTAFKILL